MFSGALQLTDLNDFITPSQECIKPIKVNKRDEKSGSIVLSEDGDYFEMKDGVREKLEKAQITLNDCLACSGCITSAESILITEQSQEEFYRIIEQNKTFEEANELEKVKVIIVSISPQSTVSIAAKHKLDLDSTARKLTAFFHDLGAKYVLDTTFSREFSLLESQKEFIRRYKAKEHGGVLPMITSACPGWVCYAEKTHGDYILPYISTVKSPQQVMGSLVKDHLATKLHLKPNQIYHLTVMPCFDKKLEASRGDFFNEVHQTRDVDCVITSIEVEAMLEAAGVQLEDLPSHTLDHLDLNSHSEWSLYTHAGSTSGGYSDQVFLHAAKELFGETVSSLQYKTLRNQDLKEVVLEGKGGEVLLRFAIANGFRNIQNIVQKLKRGKSPYHFIEVMACPSGCVNGGAQIRAPDVISQKELLSTMEKLYYSVPLRGESSLLNSLVRSLYSEWLGGEESEKAWSMLHTQYHPISKASNALLIKW